MHKHAYCMKHLQIKNLVYKKYIFAFYLTFIGTINNL
jgi:hypothetical protein